MKRPVVILGAGGHAKILYDICRQTGRPISGFLGAGERGSVHGVEILGGDELLDDPAFVSAHDFALGVGEGGLRTRLATLAADRAAVLVTLVHPSAVLSPDVALGGGTVVNAGAVINIDTCIGARCIVNTRAAIDHDCILGDDVIICPGVTLAGGVNCGDGVFIGSGATIAPLVEIGSGSRIGAGSTVLDDVPAGVTVIGSAIRSNEA